MSSNGQILNYQNKTPKIGQDVFIASGSVILGDVEIGDKSSVWFNCVLRGDINSIRVGSGTNIQDGSVIHVSRGGGKTLIGSNVVIGHMCLIHACNLNDSCMIGMGSTIMDGVTVETGSWVGSGALVTPGKVVKSGEVWMGSPAKPVREIKPFEIDEIARICHDYKELALKYS